MIDVHIDGIAFGEVPEGGISRMWANILDRLPDHGCRIRLYVPLLVKETFRFRREIEVIEYPVRHRLRPGRLFDPITEALFQRERGNMWSRVKTGVFQSTHFSTHSRIRVPQIVTVYDLFHECMPECFPEQHRMSFCARRKHSIENADAIVSISNATQRDVQSIYKRAEVPHRVVPCAVSSSFRRLTSQEIANQKRTPVAHERPFLLYVGTRYPYKNFNGLLAGFACWSLRDEFDLVVAGAPGTHAEFALMRAFGITRQVKFVGRLSDDQLVLAYNLAGAVVIPSLTEGFGLPIWEAMACGVPVVAAKGGAMTEVGLDFPVYFDFGSPQLLADAIQQAVQIPRDDDRLHRGINHATAYTWDQAAEQYATLYKEMATHGYRRTHACV